VVVRAMDKHERRGGRHSVSEVEQVQHIYGEVGGESRAHRREAHRATVGMVREASQSQYRRRSWGVFASRLLARGGIRKHDVSTSPHLWARAVVIGPLRPHEHHKFATGSCITCM